MMEDTKRGLIQVYTGDGKGKTTASVGLAVRAAGSGLNVAFIQFVKGGARSGELAMLERLGVRVERPAERSTGLLGAGIHDDDRAAADAAWALAKDVLACGDYDLVVMDELNVAMRYELVDTDDVLAVLDARPPAIEVVMTGRGAPDQIIERADLVTEMVPVKHPFDHGVPARKGIEY
ncbi:MAG: cob(I)yrinic acid a,c-diamide adenosyltransferase [Coriobacteriia bacterium]|nr:cob(I)yrinic acid a,c-diamide adenosyltransferase [Coriobacteriia bacterium]